MVDLFTREAIFQFLPSRKQELVLKAILNNIIWQRGVPASLKSDNAPELMQGIVRMIAEYLGIQQIVTGS